MDATMTPDDVALRFRDSLKEIGMTQAEFAARIGKSQSYVSAIVRGRKRLSGRVMDGLVQCGISVDYILTGVGAVQLSEDALSAVRDGGIIYERQGKAAVIGRLKAAIKAIERDWPDQNGGR